MKYKAIIFDLFGTLVDNVSVQEYKKFLTDMASTLGLLEEDFSKFWRDTRYDRGIGIFKTTEEIIKYISDKLKTPVREDSINKCNRIRMEMISEGLTPKSGAINILKNLRGLGYKMGLISNCSAYVPLLWKNTEFSSLFDVTIFSALVGLLKPDSQIYNLACEQLEVNPSECLFIGDGGGNELSGASQAGMDAVMICDPNERDFYRPVDVNWEENWNGCVIKNFSEVLHLL